jgi:ketosteroid isomerase-like protein
MNHSISQILARLHQAVNNDDLKSINNCYAENARVVVTPAGQSEHDCIEALQLFQQKYMSAHRVTRGDEVVIEAGDIALVVSKLYLVPKSAPNAMPCDPKKAVYVMQRQPNGQWRCIIDNFFGTDLLDFS